ncbi:hypothetical protein LDFHOB_01985 [Candidatus Electronema aureum]
MQLIYFEKNKEEGWKLHEKDTASSLKGDTDNKQLG